MKKSLLILVLVSLSCNTSASDIDILNIGDTDHANIEFIVGTGSYHHDSLGRQVLNQFNPAIGIEAWDISVVYTNDNSWGDDSFYITYTPDYQVNDWLSLRAQVGFATGYSNDSIIYLQDPVEGGYRYYQNEMYIYNGITPIFAVGAQIEFVENITVNIDVSPFVTTFSASYHF